MGDTVFTEDSRISVSATNKSNKLFIDDVRQSDEGEYICSYVHKDFSQRKLFTLHVGTDGSNNDHHKSDNLLLNKEV